jgi:hypothetical protein
MRFSSREFFLASKKAIFVLFDTTPPVSFPVQKVPPAA